MTPTAEQVLPLIGVPRRPGYNCWDFAAEAFLALTGSPLPGHPGEALRGAAHHPWKRLESPGNALCVVAMARRGEPIRHVGLYIPLDNGYVLHCPRAYSVATRLPDVAKYGITELTFYDYDIPSSKPI